METETPAGETNNISSRVKEKFSPKNVAEDVVATLVVMSLIGASKLISKAVVKKYQARQQAKADQPKLELAK